MQSGWTAVSKLIVVLTLAAASGCVAVKPWERGRLSHSAMSPVAQVGDSYRPHVLSIREGAAGGEGEVGGGCGCN